MTKPYDQREVDERFEALLQRCRRHGYRKLADHYANAQGMQRVHAVRFLEALFAIREENIYQRTRLAAVAFAGLVALFLTYLMWRGIP